MLRLSSRLLLLSLALLPSAAFALGGYTRVDLSATSVFDGVAYTAHDESTSGASLALSHDVMQTAYGRTSAVVGVDAIAASNAGEVRALARTEFPGVVYCTGSPFCNGIGTVRGSARAVATQGADDIVFSGTGPFTTSITLDLTGSVQRIYSWIDGTTNATYTGGLVPDATVNVDFNLYQLVPGDCEGTPCTVSKNLAAGWLELTSRYDGKTSLVSSGFKNAPSVWSDGTHHLESRDFTVNPSYPVSMFFEIVLDSAEQYSHSGGDHILSGLDFAHSFGLTTAGPVFALGGGETVGSASLGLAGNLFTPVPEPATALSCALGLALLARLRRS